MGVNGRWVCGASGEEFTLGIDPKSLHAMILMQIVIIF